MGKESRANPFVTRAGGAPVVCDYARRPLQVGDEIALMNGQVQRYQVAAITPVLDPALPPGLFDVTFVSQVRFRAKAGIANPEFGILRTAEEFLPPEKGEAS